MSVDAAKSPASSHADAVLEQCYLCVLSQQEPVESSAPDAAELRRTHREFLDALERRGLLFGGGPFVASHGWRASDVGMFVVRADDRAAAEAIAAPEPLTQAGACTLRIVPWQRNGGAIQLTIRFANRELEVDGRRFAVASTASTGSISSAIVVDESADDGIVYACLMQANASPPPSAPPVEQLRRDHQVFLRDLERSGGLVASGPLRDAVGPAADVGTGLIIVRAADRETALALIGNEPYVRAGVRRASVASWRREAASFSLRVDVGSGDLAVDARRFAVTTEPNG